MNTKLALLMALVFGFIAAIAVRSWLTEEEVRQRTEAEPLAFLAAARRLPKGEILKAQDCKQIFVPQKFVTSGMIPFIEHPRYLGRVLNRELEPDRPIFEDFLDSATRTTSIARTAVQPNRRAVTIQVDQVSGVAGLIRPGDYVDVIGTFIDDRDKVRRITKTVYLLQAARVMAIDNRILTADVGQLTAARTGSYRTVTLEVRPEDAMRLISANHTGNLQLILRNPAEASLAQGVIEVQENGDATQQRATEYWDITEEIFDISNNK